jgi:hypothetical protein
MIVGPAGSGKTTAAQKVAEMLGLPFYFTGAINSEYKLTGFIDAQGRIVNTAFRKAFVEGGVFLFDEMDGSLPAATLAFNAATANRVFDFPDGTHEAHPDFIALAACNTYGNGASRQYVGRNQLDAATLDRYATLEWNYDEALEAAIMGLPRPGGAPRTQVDLVQHQHLASDRLQIPAFRRRIDHPHQHVGLFDESFYPAYWEDIDYERRVRAAGIPVLQSNIVVNHDNSSTINSDPELRRKNDRTFGANHAYYADKVKRGDVTAGTWSLTTRRANSWD